MRSVALVLSTLTTLLVLSFAAAAPAAQAAGPRIDRGERAVVRAINRARASHGLRRLHAGRRLARAADVHSRSMLRSDFFSHGAFSQRVRRYVRFRRIGETIAMRSRCSARGFVRMWLNSPPPPRRAALARLPPRRRRPPHGPPRRPPRLPGDGGLRVAPLGGEQRDADRAREHDDQRDHRDGGEGERPPGQDEPRAAGARSGAGPRGVAADTVTSPRARGERARRRAVRARPSRAARPRSRAAPDP